MRTIVDLTRRVVLDGGLMWSRGRGWPLVCGTWNAGADTWHWFYSFPSPQAARAWLADDGGIAGLGPEPDDRSSAAWWAWDALRDAFLERRNQRHG